MHKPYLYAALFGAIMTVLAVLSGCSGLTVKASYQYPPAEDRK